MMTQNMLHGYRRTIQDGRQNNPDVDSEDDSDPNAECYLYDDDFLFDRSDPYGPFELSTSCGFSTPPSHTASALSSDSFNAQSRLPLPSLPIII